jgi:hypothetical protein
MDRERNETYKHLEDPTRLGPLTIGQWAALFPATLAAILFGMYVSPLPPGPTIIVSVWLAGFPVALSWVVTGKDLAVKDTMVFVWRWVRGEKHYLPGPGTGTAGYVVERVVERVRVARPAGDTVRARDELRGVWDHG